MEIKKRILNYLIESILYNSSMNLDYNTPLYSSGLLSSLDHLKLINFLEKNFITSIDFNNLYHTDFDTITLISSYISGIKNV